jgi:Rha family phage regulatory protein
VRRRTGQNQHEQGEFTIMNKENQLVTLHGRNATTTSLIVAKVLGKRHDNVIRAIENLIADLPANDRRNFEGVNGLNFEESKYIDSKGETRKMYEMTRDGFSLLAMGFTGKKALEWKLKFLAAFNLMEKTLLNQQNLSWQQDRNQGKIARRGETDVIQRFVEYAINQGSKKAQMYYMNITNMTYRALFLVADASPKPFRDILDSMQLSFLTTAEYLIQAALDEGMKKSMYYKDVYQLCRDRVVGYAQQLPSNRLEVRPAQSLLFN